MAIHPPSDLILDVARAADPAASQAAVERLKAMSLQKTAAAGATPLDVPTFDVPETGGAQTTGLRIEKKPDAYSKFESFVLQTFIQSMFAGEEDQEVFGKGASGQYWKSMLAGAIADNMAQSGGIGLAKMLRSEARQREVAAATENPGAAAASGLAIPGAPRSTGPVRPLTRRTN